MTRDEEQRYRARVETMSDEELTKEIERQSFLAARCSSWSDYDERCSILSQHNTPLYDAVRARLERSLRAR